MCTAAATIPGPIFHPDRTSIMKRRPLLAAAAVTTLALLVSGPAAAQFTGPGVTAPTSSVASVQGARLGSYVTVVGNIVNHQRGNYFTFRDATGDLRVEIESAVWAGRPVNPETKVRLIGEVGSTAAGRYLWVKSLEMAG
jgi:uncharacterized protein (TIGR00156 family)